MGRGFYPFLIGVLMNWYVIDKDYITYLLQFDSRVGYVEYGDRLNCTLVSFWPLVSFYTMFQFLHRKKSIASCPTVWIFISCKTLSPVISTQY